MISGSTLKALRVSAGLTQKQIGLLLGNGGYTDKHIGAIENGKRNIGMNLLVDWADACGYDVSIDFTKRNAASDIEDNATLILPDDFNEPD